MASPDRTYTYEPVYRLRTAAGREHIGQTEPNQPGPADPQLFPDIPHVNDQQAMRGYTETYDYDPVGNFIKLHHHVDVGTDWTRHYTTAPDSNRLTATSQPADPADGPYRDTYTYDAQGNTTRMPHLNELQWNDRNQLVRVDLGGGGTAYYHYDSTGQRIRAVVDRNGATRDERLYHDAAEHYRHYTDDRLDNERETLHVHDNTQRLALVETTTITNANHIAEPTPAARHQLADHLHSSTIELDYDAAVLSYEEYHPYGTTSFHAATGTAETSLKRYRYTGKEKDQETGLYYYGARFYISWIGRWCSCDPASANSATNRYQFCEANPVGMVDPDGSTEVPALHQVDGNLYAKGEIGGWSAFPPGSSGAPPEGVPQTNPSAEYYPDDRGMRPPAEYNPDDFVPTKPFETVENVLGKASKFEPLLDKFLSVASKAARVAGPLGAILIILWPSSTSSSDTRPYEAPGGGPTKEPYEAPPGASAPPKTLPPESRRDAVQEPPAVSTPMRDPDGSTTSMEAVTVKVNRARKIGQEAHRQILRYLYPDWLHELSLELEPRVTVRKDAFRLTDKGPEVVIVKPDTPTGRAAAVKRQELMERYGYSAKVHYYDPKSKEYQPGSKTYIGPK